METEIQFEPERISCVMCSEHAWAKEPEHNEPLCRKCYSINSNIIRDRR